MNEKSRLSNYMQEHYWPCGNCSKHLTCCQLLNVFALQHLVTTSVKYVTLTIDLSNHRYCLISVNMSQRSVTSAIIVALRVVTSGFIAHVDSSKGNGVVSRFTDSSRSVRRSILKRKCKSLK